MIDHVVLLRMSRGHDAQKLADVMAGLAGLVGQIDGFVAFRRGPNLDLEGRSSAYDYGFICHMRDRAVLAAYAHDAAHVALGVRLMTLCDDLLVADLESA
jgi:hypothetical protein